MRAPALDNDPLVDSVPVLLITENNPPLAELLPETVSEVPFVNEIFPLVVLVALNPLTVFAFPKVVPALELVVRSPPLNVPEADSEMMPPVKLIFPLVLVTGLLKVIRPAVCNVIFEPLVTDPLVDNVPVPLMTANTPPVAELLATNVILRLLLKRILPEVVFVKLTVFAKLLPLFKLIPPAALTVKLPEPPDPVVIALLSVTVPPVAIDNAPFREMVGNTMFEPVIPFTVKVLVAESVIPAPPPIV